MSIYEREKQDIIKKRLKRYAVLDVFAGTEGTRTLTSLRPLAPQASVSTNSTTIPLQEYPEIMR